MVIAGMVKSSLVDYPGRPACVLFTSGCNSDCYFCHNRGLIDGNCDALPLIDVMGFLNKRAGVLGAAVITGGEPLLQTGLLEFLIRLRGMGYKVKLDTNGSMPERLAEVLDAGLSDYVAVDYKSPAARYREFCGPRADAEKVRKSIRLLQSGDQPFEVRTTVTPQLTLSDLQLMARELPKALPRWALHRYRKPESFLPEHRERIEAPAYTQAEIEAFAKELRALQPGATG
mgnify:CR=1 FL=1